VVINIFEQDHTGIGRQLATIEVEVNGFGPNWCQGQRCLLRLEHHIGLHRIKT
jgi:hypothetical protein